MKQLSRTALSAWWIGLGALTCSCACSAPSSPAGPSPKPPLPRVELSLPGGKTVAVKVEIARTPKAWARGLMFRKHLPAMSGMYFILPQERVLSLWMKDTLIPLDMIFIDRSGRVVGIVERAEPKTLTPRMVRQPSLAVLEVNGGFCAKHGVVPGTAVRLVERGGARAE